MSGLQRCLTAGLVAVCMLAAPPRARAALLFDVTIDTSNLANIATGPYYLDFQLTNGGANFGNTATISNFNFGSGSPVASAIATTGAASGDLSSSVTLSSSGPSFDNELYQQFNPGQLASFTVSLSTIYSPGGGSTSITPDVFAVAILDSSTNPIPTTDPSGNNTLVTVTIDSANPTVGQFQPYVAPAPEPSTVVLLGVSLACLACCGLGKRWRLRTAA
jgi:hypothetical protein